MLRPTLLYSVLQMLTLFNNFKRNDCGVLRMNWVDVDQTKSGFIDAAKNEVVNLRAFKNVDSNNLELLQSAGSTLEAKYVLLLCRITHLGSKITLFYAALTETSDQKFILNSIGGILDVDEYTDLKCVQVKLVAEHYRRSKYAFRSSWILLPSEHLDTNGPCKYILKPHSFWTVVEEKEMVVLYANEQNSVGAYATMKLSPSEQAFTVIKYESVSGPLAVTFDALWKYLDTGLDFEHTWKLVKGEIEPLSQTVGSVLTTSVAWLQTGLAVTMFARTLEEDGILSTIFQTSGSYSANTLLAIWDVKKNQLLHASLPSTLEKTLSNYRWFRTSEFWGKPFQFDRGLGWWQTSELLSKTIDNNVIRNTIASKFPAFQGKLEIRSAGLLPSENYWSNMPVCIIFGLSEGTNHAMVTLNLQTLGGISSQALTIQDLDVVGTAALFDDAKHTIGNIIKRKYSSDSIEWIPGHPENFFLPVTKSLLSYLYSTNGEILFYFIQHTNMLMILQYNDRNGHSNACFIALKQQGATYDVTWIGTDHTIGSGRDGIQDAKQEAKSYHFTSTFAYEEKWEPQLCDVTKLEDGTTEKLFVWKEKSTKNEITIWGFFYNGGYQDFWYEKSVTKGTDEDTKNGSNPSNDSESGTPCNKLGEALQYLESEVLAKLLDTTLSKWKKSDHVFDNKDDVELILDSAPWNAKTHQISVQEECDTNETSDGITIYISYLNPYDPKSKFLVVWNHSAATQIQKLLYVSGLGTIENVRGNARRYHSSPMAFEETEFRRGIAWYDNPTPIVENVRITVHHYLEKEYLKVNLSPDTRGNFGQCHFGRISPTPGAKDNSVVEYLLLGNICPPGKPPVYNSIVIRVEERKESVTCLSLRTEETEFVLEAENNLEKLLIHGNNTKYHVFKADGTYLYAPDKK